MQKKKQKKSLRGRMNLAFLLIVAIAVGSFMIVSVRSSSEAMKNTSVNYTHQLIHMVNENINSYIENMENISQIVTKNSDVRNYLSKEETAGFAIRVQELFVTLKGTRKDIYNIGIVGENGSYLINDRHTRTNPYVTPEELDWYQKAIEEGQAISSSHVQNLVRDEYPWVVTLSKTITDPITGEILGVFFADLNYRAISDLAEEMNIGQKSYIYMLDEEGAIIYHPKQQLIYSGLWQEEELIAIESTQNNTSWEVGDKLYSFTKSDITGWSVIGVTDLNEMLLETEELVNLYYVIAVLLMGVAMLLSLFLTDKITRPLRNLQETMKIVEHGDFEVEIADENTQDEIGDLIHTFRIMVQRIEQLIERNTKEQKEKRKMELNALQAQIQPHFLYNTLDSIIWMAEGGNNEDVVLMTSALAKLLRKSISNKRELVTVTEELEYTRSYLIIQKMRYQGELQYSIEVEPAIADVEIAKLLVQPLVENAIYHGIKYKKGCGKIEIKANYQDKGILIQISDNGRGMTKEELAHIFDEREIDTKKNSVGVLNVHNRIRLYYGEKYGLSFESEQNKGTIVYVYLPVQMGELYEK